VTRGLKRLFSYVTPQIPSNPKVVHFSEVAALLGISIEDTKSMNSQTYFQERTVTPFPSVFDELRRTSIWKWAGQLGDGRAIILAEIENKNKQLKGGYDLLPQSRWFSSTAFFYTSICAAKPCII
jgi:uncharacterized protein YdiU (UPF0061 family)